MSLSALAAPAPSNACQHCNDNKKLNDNDDNNNNDIGKTSDLIYVERILPRDAMLARY